MRRWYAMAVVGAPCWPDAAAAATPTTWPRRRRRCRWIRSPPAVLKAAKEAEPDLTFFAAYKDTFKGQDSIELKGKTKSGKIKEVEVSPSGQVLGSE